jgi:hypothetical protein
MEPAPAWPIPGTVGGDVTFGDSTTPFEASQWANGDTGTVEGGTTTEAWTYGEGEPSATDAWTYTDEPATVDTGLGEWAPAAPAEPAHDDARAPWAHEPDPQATSTGFYVDWGEPEDSTKAEPAAWEALAPPADPPAFETYTAVEPQPEPEPEQAFALREDEQPATASTDTFDTLDTLDTYETFDVAVEDDTPEPDFEAGPDPLPTISWRPQWDDTPAPVAAAVAVAASAVVAVEEATIAAPEPQFLPGPEPEPVREERFVVAGSEWELGNALPLVEVRSTGSLVMRRADERWALADVVVSTDFALEVYLDFRSGPGFGVLFRAETDAEGRMSGYSFDIDPVYEGGGYLVREWKADRELWNPIAHVAAANPQELHGLLAVRLTVDDDRLVAW